CRTQILISGLEERSLGVEHVEKFELAKLKSLGRCVVSTLCTGQDFLYIEVHRLTGSQQALVGLGKVIVQAYFGCKKFVFSLVCAAQGLLQIALIAIEEW